MVGKLIQELTYFFSGLSFYTRIPCPKWVIYRPHNLNKSRKYLPLIGLLIGAVAVLVFVISRWLLPVSISIALSMIATVYLTGAFHEDGLADCADGFGGGWEKSQILSIMKDSRMGAFGTLSLILVLGFKFLVLWELQQVSETLMLWAMVTGHSMSRLMASLIMQRYDYVSENSTSKSQSVTSVKLSGGEMAWSVLPLVMLATLGVADASVGLLLLMSLLASLLALGVATWRLARYYQQRIGGYTGDCLGATQQLTEVLHYLVLIVIYFNIDFL